MINFILYQFGFFLLLYNKSADIETECFIRYINEQ